MSTPNVSVFMLRRLREWGVKRIYGYPGDGTDVGSTAITATGASLMGASGVETAATATATTSP